MIRKKSALSQRELETEKILQEQLPEYTIRANMRLADVIHAGRQFKYMQGYHLDFVITDDKANTIAAVELDDSTHETEDGKRRDNNKNKWMAEAKIKLIRIRQPEEARDIRRLIEKQEIPDPEQFRRKEEKPKTLHEILSMNDYANVKTTEHNEEFRFSRSVTPSFEISKSKKPLSKNQRVLLSTGISIATILGLAFAVNAYLQSTFEKMKTNAVARQNQMQHDLQQREAQQKMAQEQQLKEAQTRQTWMQPTPTNNEPQYQKVLVKGRTARECAPNGVITNAAIRCTQDHYEWVQINGPQ